MDVTIADPVHGAVAPVPADDPRLDAVEHLDPRPVVVATAVLAAAPPEAFTREIELRFAEPDVDPGWFALLLLGVPGPAAVPLAAIRDHGRFEAGELVVRVVLPVEVEALAVLEYETEERAWEAASQLPGGFGLGAGPAAPLEAVESAGPDEIPTSGRVPQADIALPPSIETGEPSFDAGHAVDLPEQQQQQQQQQQEQQEQQQDFPSDLAADDSPVAAAPVAAEPVAAAPATAAHIDASMPAEIVTGEPFELVFRLSREELLALPGTVRREDVVEVDPDRDVIVALTVRGLRHAPGSRAERRTRLPDPGGDPAEVRFRLVGDEPGRATAWIAVRQDPVELPLATLRISAPIVEAPAGPGLEPLLVVGRVTGRPVDLAKLPTIRIDESMAGTRSTLRIAVSIGEDRETCTATLTDKAGYLDRLYRRIAGIRRAAAKKPDPRARRREAERLLAEVGSSIAARLFDDRVNALLWRSRHRLAHLVVQTEGEFDLPWEIMHLVPPTGTPGDGKRWFLADLGMTRLVYHAAVGDIPLRAGRALAVSPKYRDPALDLPRTADEVAVLAERLHPRVLLDVDLPRGISDALGSGVDLVHFAGHGRWRADVPTAQQLLLAGFPADGGDESSAYSDADARDDFPERDDDEEVASVPGFVFLSACDVGRLQSGPTGLGGFAEAFLRGGVSAFVGCGWAVRDDVASRFVAAFYESALDDGRPIGEATLEARRAARRSGDLSALAFAVFADPRTRLVRSD